MSEDTLCGPAAIARNDARLMSSAKQLRVSAVPEPCVWHKTQKNLSCQQLFHTHFPSIDEGDDGDDDDNDNGDDDDDDDDDADDDDDFADDDENVDAVVDVSL